jgi:hypothetical protein
MPAEARTYGNGSSEMRVSLSTYGSHGDVEAMVGLAVRLRALGAELLASIEFPGWGPTINHLAAEVQMGEESEWGIRRDILGIHSLSRMGVR